MNVYAITYYLKEDTHSCGCEDHHEEHHHHHHRDDYEITGNIKALGAWAHLMPTSFLVKCELTADEISTKLKEFLQDKDMLFVTEVTKDNVASLTPGVVEWINQ
ncbi:MULTISPECIES: hypothetical protein [Clostridium]|uniref:Uncharacterized protein n=1 Tax=Clostridium aquiflavi TaxID=3073603 RepID=A0ABU1EC23_9CLOT|nr:MULTISPECIES: hypothetical protein [unclassified Clostridium]MDR5585927.1 hypothetical protein [Clostridium sp. 5N-1]NFG60927.1 hypothetical protein [Clostridium botulinum]NFQ09488.1 hypothetical protein [Clostridium botulinum]